MPFGNPAHVRKADSGSPEIFRAMQAMERYKEQCTRYMGKLAPSPAVRRTVSLSMADALIEMIAKSSGPVNFTAFANKLSRTNYSNVASAIRTVIPAPATRRCLGDFRRQLAAPALTINCETAAFRQWKRYSIVGN